MIDVKSAKEEFIKYRNLFDKNNANIERKYIHTINVMEISGIIASSLNLKEEEVNLAKLIGLLHDIARFEEYKDEKEEKTFINFKKYNHANKGIEILKENNFIRKFTPEKEYDDIIFTAIRNHNKNRIQENLSKKEILFCNILRDADKIDIFRLATTTYWKNEFKQIEYGKINEDMLNEFCNHRTIDISKFPEKTQIDKLIKILALIYDLNYKKSFEILSEHNYFNKIIERFNFYKEETNEKMKIVKKIGNDFINSKL